MRHLLKGTSCYSREAVAILSKTTTLATVTKPQGRIVLSMNNPNSALIREKVHSYFDFGQATLYNMARDDVAVYYYHRTLEEYIMVFSHADFLLRGLIDVCVALEIAELIGLLR
jgi:hypothetical protein